MKTLIGWLILMLLALPVMADTPERIGVVSALQGSASAKLGNAAARPLAVRQPLYRNDVITTGAGSRCVLLFADMTTFCLGASSALRVEQYIAGHAAQFEMQRGTFRMMSGEIARTNPTQFNMSTPTASIGIRGTTTGHEIGEQGERHMVLDMEPGHQVIISGLNNGNRLVINADLTAVTVNPQGGVGPREQLTEDQAQNFTRQFVIDDPRAFLPPPLDANGNPLLPPLLDANGNPLPPPPMYDASGNPLPPPPVQLDANGNPLPPPPVYDAAGNPLPLPPPGGTYLASGSYPPLPVMYDASGNPLPPPPVYDAAGNLLPPPPLPPPPGTFTSFAPNVTGDLIVPNTQIAPFNPTHMAGTMLFYNISGNTFINAGTFATNGLVPLTAPPTFAGFSMAGSLTTGDNVANSVTAINVSPSYNWSGNATGYKVSSGGYIVPGTQNKYLEWGTWNLSDPNFLFDGGVGQNRLARAHYIEGVKTPDLRIAELGAANVIGTYNGGARGTYMAAAGSPQDITGTFNCQVNFGTNQVTNAAISFPAPAITLSQGAGATTLNANGTFNINLSGNPQVVLPNDPSTGSGFIRGGTFGPNAEGVGGTWGASGFSSSNERAEGTFSGTR